MVERAQRRASGETGAVEEAKAVVETVDQEIAVDVPEDRARKWRTPGFSRMRYSWRTEDQPMMSTLRTHADNVVVSAFEDAYQLMYELFSIVREPMLDPTGEQIVDHAGLPVWKRRPDGGYIEDYSRLTRRQREDILFTITTNLFAWEQRAAVVWGDAMIAKAQFEERFAIAYDEPVKGTVDDRIAAGNRDAAEERYFAIYESILSRRADAIVRSMERISQRLKDVMQSS